MSTSTHVCSNQTMINIVNITNVAIRKSCFFFCYWIAQRCGRVAFRLSKKTRLKRWNEMIQRIALVRPWSTLTKQTDREKNLKVLELCYGSFNVSSTVPLLYVYYKRLRFHLVWMQAGDNGVEEVYIFNKTNYLTRTKQVSKHFWLKLGFFWLRTHNNPWFYFVFLNERYKHYSNIISCNLSQKHFSHLIVTSSSRKLHHIARNSILEES